MEDLRYIESNALLVYDDWYVKPKIRTYGDKGYTNFRGLNVPEEDKNFYWFFICTRKQILLESIFRKLCLKNYKQTNDKSW